MPFGTTLVGDVFQCKLDQCVGQIKNVIVIADDIMIVGKKANESDHDQALITLLDAARKCNICLNYGKLQYKMQEVNLLGETYTIDGHMPAQTKVSAITEMPPPTCKKQFQSFIGMIKYLSTFSGRFSELAEPIRELSKENVPFKWRPEYQDAFIMMKKEIAKVPVLASYNSKKQTILQTDACIKGIGACLLQEKRPVFFASKALTEA